MINNSLRFHIKHLSFWAHISCLCNVSSGHLLVTHLCLKLLLNSKSWRFKLIAILFWMAPKTFRHALSELADASLGLNAPWHAISSTSVRPVVHSSIPRTVKLSNCLPAGDALRRTTKPKTIENYSHIHMYVAMHWELMCLGAGSNSRGWKWNAKDTMSVLNFECHSPTIRPAGWVSGANVHKNE